MSDDVQFDTDMQSMPIRRPGSPQQGSGAMAGVPASGGGMAGWIMRHGLAKSASGAQAILVAVILADIIATFIVIKYFL